MANALKIHERKLHIKTDILDQCSGIASRILFKPPALPFNSALLAYSHCKVPNPGYFICL
jgi:hypothetical protein